MKAVSLTCLAALILCTGCRGIPEPSNAEKSQMLVEQAKAECRRMTDASAAQECMRRAQQVYGGSSR